LRKPSRRDNDWFSDGTGTVHQSGSIDLIRARLVRALLAPALVAATLALGGCYGDEVYQLPTRAMKELSPQMLALLEKKGMPKDSPILVRIFKEESELEVWKKDGGGRFQLLKVYPICRWSGDLGPKVHEGDRQAPEGFYQITPDLMNPNSNYYLAINTGFPNTYDRANGRTGALLMIHGDCSSRGCYAMTDEEIGEIYSLAREAFLGGQQSFQIQAYPFRMTPLNMARHRNNPNMAFWGMIKQGNDHFEVTRLEPKVDVCNRHYVFDAVPPANATKPLTFNPTRPCPNFTVAPDVARLVQQKEHNDAAQYAQLVGHNVPTAPIRTGLDGGMNRVFLAQVGSIPPARKTAGSQGGLPPQPPAVMVDSAEPTLASRMLGSLFGAKPAAASTQVAAGEAGAQEAGDGNRGFFNGLFGSAPKEPAAAAPPTVTAAIEPSKPRSTPHVAAHGETAAAKPAEPHKAEHRQSEPNNAAPHDARPQETAAAKPKATPQQEANAAAPPAANGNLINGAQAMVPVGNFESRWNGLR